MITGKVQSTWRGDEVKIKGKKIVGKSVYEAGLIVLGQTITLCPVLSGRLKGSYTVQIKSKGTAVKSPAGGGDKITPPRDEDEALVGTAVDYGPYVEYGTVKMAAQPHLRPAFDLSQGKTLTVFEKNGRFEFKEYLK